MDLFYSLCALGATLSFSLGSQVYQHYSHIVHAYWLAGYKACISLIGFFVLILIMNGFSEGGLSHIFQTIPNREALTALLISGAIGLNIGDLFMIKSFSTIGPSRTFMIYGFEPLVFGVIETYLFGAPLRTGQGFAVVFLVLCVFTLSYEGYKRDRKWQTSGLIYAVLGVCFDVIGITLTKYAFRADPNLDVYVANFVRAVSAVVLFAVASPLLFKLSFKRELKKLSPKGLIWVSSAAFLATFLALILWLTAISKGHLATVTAIGGSSPLFAGLFECIRQKRFPSRFMLLAFMWFLFGFLILFKGTS
jgi:drug/metabolite transporter (DMT)-like permease